MTSLRAFSAFDLLKFNNVNLVRASPYVPAR